MNLNYNYKNVFNFIVYFKIEILLIAFYCLYFRYFGFYQIFLPEFTLILLIISLFQFKNNKSNKNIYYSYIFIIIGIGSLFFKNHALDHFTDFKIKRILVIINYINFTLVLISLLVQKYKKYFIIISVFIISLIFIQFSLIPAISPKPYIDVVSIPMEFSKLLLNGDLFIYDHQYTNIYLNNQQYKFLLEDTPESTNTIVYWSFISIMHTISYYVFGNTRSISIFFHLIVVLIIYFILKKKQNGLIYALIFSLFWLSYPFHLKTIENGWNEIFTVPFIILAFNFLHRKSYTISFILGIIAVNIKFHCGIALFPMFIYLLTKFNFKDLKVVILFSILGTALMHPFFFISPNSYFKYTFLSFIKIGIRVDSFSWASFIKRHCVRCETILTILSFFKFLLATFILIIRKKINIFNLPIVCSIFFTTILITEKRCFINYLLISFTLLFIHLLYQYSFQFIEDEKQILYQKR